MGNGASLKNPLDLTSLSAETLRGWVREARHRTLALAEDMSDHQLLGPRLDIVNPFLWEIGHVAWFQERWILSSTPGSPSSRPDLDELYDSMDVSHDSRWSLSLPSLESSIDYLREVEARTLARIEEGLDPALRYFILLSVFHEDMHFEAFVYTRQTLGWSRPAFLKSPSDPGGLDCPGDVEVAGGRFELGAPIVEEYGFVFDNEQWGHPKKVRPFRMARAPVTQAEFAAFVEDDGYGRPDLWLPEGWNWREREGAEHPLHWRREPSGEWLRRDFDQWHPLEPWRPVMHVNWFEARAYCEWAGRRLPTEVEWEVAAAGSAEGNRLSATKRHFPWGDSAPDPARANLDARQGGCVDVGAHAQGDSAFGCRQLIGNVWEWTEDECRGYPGFQAGPYEAYSEPWFGTHRVARGGAWITPSRTIRNTWRNFYTPDRRDPWLGFRTCARPEN